MANRINSPQLALELAAAGARTDGLSVNVESGTPAYSPGALGAWSEADEAKVATVIAAHDPTKLSTDQIYAAAIAAGCQVQSTATPALNATYALDPLSADELAQLVLGVQAGNFPSGSTIPWPDQAGAIHDFAPADLVNLGKALETYVLALAAQKRGGAAPVQPVAIA